MIGKIINIKGKRFGRLVALEIVGRDSRGETIWKFQCDCGNTKNIISSSVRYGTVKSCGCFNRESLSNRRAGLNENYFNIPNIENCYWAGFIAADGNIYQHPNENWQKKLSIGLSKIDVEHLERFKNDIGYTGNIHSFTSSQGRDTVSIQITSNKICDDLENNFNITQRKSNTLEPPYTLNNEVLIKSFIRGYIDGDGSIGVYRGYGRLSILGTKKFLEWIRYQLGLYCNIEMNSVKQSKNKKLHYMYVTGIKCKQVLFDLRRLETPFLQRKWVKTVLM